MDEQPDEVIRPKLGDWSLHAREKELFATADKLPTWRLADNCRRSLLDVVKRCGDLLTPKGELVADLDARTARQMAAVALGQVTVRSVSARMMLIATGYEREALSQARVSVEALIRLQHINADGSGEAARQVLMGRPSSNLKRLAQRYGDEREIRTLDHFAHADVISIRTLGDLSAPGQREGLVELRPQRGRLRPAWQLYDAAHLTAMVSAGVVEPFDGVAVQLSAWITEQLIHHRDNPLPDPL
jgi:hypothetical protein